ncbi:MAG TPA: fumarylacetoacetase [Ideonella sp.]|nr:fumarylacetoacetase [Ideonella sp.]
MNQVNATHDPALRSWVASANLPGCDFPVQNLPHGVFRAQGSHGAFRGGVAIGDSLLDMAAAHALGVFEGLAGDAARLAGAASLNGLMALGPAAWSALRAALSQALRAGSGHAHALRGCLLPQAEVEYAVPAAIGDYTDFFTSEHHALNAGRIFQPDRPLLPQFKWLPIGYHGRASSVAIGGTACRRPLGQYRPAGAATPVYAPTEALDFELELGAYIGAGNRLGERVAIAQAEQQLFGVCLLNDWSARDVQAWEAMPLGPFLAKNFLTSVSPWIVTMEALAPFRTDAPRAVHEPDATPAYLRTPQPGAWDIQLDAWLQPAGGPAEPITRSNARHAHWTLAQLVAHHTEGGCPLRPGDLFGTGTLSGPQPGEEACLLELTRGGQVPLRLCDGSERRWLHDGDTLTLRGWCERPGAVRIGLGHCSGRVVAAAG